MAAITPRLRQRQGLRCFYWRLSHADVTADTPSHYITAADDADIYFIEPPPDATRYADLPHIYADCLLMLMATLPSAIIATTPPLAGHYILERHYYYDITMMLIETLRHYYCATLLMPRGAGQRRGAPPRHYAGHAAKVFITPLHFHMS